MKKIKGDYHITEFWADQGISFTLDIRRKSEEKMKEIISGGAATILVSHSVKQVRELCARILWLDHGEQVLLSEDTEMACDLYQRYLDKEIRIKDIRPT